MNKLRNTYLARAGLIFFSPQRRKGRKGEGKLFADAKSRIEISLYKNIPKRRLEIVELKPFWFGTTVSALSWVYLLKKAFDKMIQ